MSSTLSNNFIVVESLSSGKSRRERDPERDLISPVVAAAAPCWRDLEPERDLTVLLWRWGEYAWRGRGMCETATRSGEESCRREREGQS